MCRTPNVFLSSDLRWHAVKIFPPWCSQNRPFIHPSQPGLTPVFSLPYLPGLALPISSSLILTPHSLPPHPLPNVHADTLPVHYLVSRNVSIAARHLLQTSRASQWHHYKPELTFCTDTSCQNMATLHLQRRGGYLRVQRCERSWDLPDKNCTLVRGWSIGADLSPSGDLLGPSHPFLSLAPVMTASLQIFADTNQN